jgi:hypothetical protein
MKLKLFLLSSLLFASTIVSCGQENSKTSAHATVDFSRKIRTWDGFGFNYVQTSQTFDFKKNPQDYGGFSILKEKDREEILNLIFGEEGLKVNILKMFLDPFHQRAEGGPYDHVTTTRHMVDFAKRGVQKTRQRGDDISIISTMYGPPGYMTKQKMIRGRDLDPAYSMHLCEYFAHWAEFLLHREQLPLRYISLHNEGEDWGRWPADGSVEDTHKDGHDYNFFWSPEQTTTILKMLRPLFDKRGLKNVGITNGEYTNWYRFNAWGFAGALERDTFALRQIALITSHGFYVGSMTAGHWFGPHSSSGTDRLRAIRPELHAWTTSTAWNAFTRQAPRVYYMNEQFIKEVHGSILDAKVNAIIPWAGIQRASQWNKPDPNPGCAIRVFDDGTWEIQKGYYYYKQVSRAGQAGMAVADAFVMSSELSILAFASNGTTHSNAIVVINQSEEPREISIGLKGSQAFTYTAFRTSGRQDYKMKSTAEIGFLEGDNYKPIGDFKVRNSSITYLAPAHSVTTFFEINP